jgi:hypothetical protein
MKYIKALHGVFETAKDELLLLFQCVDDLVDLRIADLTVYARRFTITSSEGDELDMHGVELNLPRLPSESDANYRERLKDVRSARVVTPKYILEAVNKFLLRLGFVGEASIVEWFQPNNYSLNPGWFAVDLPLESKTGFFLNYSHMNYVGTTRNRKESFLSGNLSHLRALMLPDLSNMIFNIRASGVRFKMMVDGSEVIS